MKKKVTIVDVVIIVFLKVNFREIFCVLAVKQGFKNEKYEVGEA